MNNFLFYALAFIVALSVLVVVHELGHFSMARFFDVKVLRFSLGFGRVLYKKRLGRDGTEWVLSAVPLGGYVKMLGDDDDPVSPEERHRAFGQQNVWRRMAIAVAGPAANFLLAILLFWAVFVLGSEDFKPLWGAPEPGTPAALAGFQEGELAQAVDGEPVQTWQDLRWSVLRRAAEKEAVEIQTLDRQHEIHFRRLDLSPARESGLAADSLKQLGLVLFRPKIPPVIDRVMQEGAAFGTGIAPGDEVVAIDGEPIADSSEMIARIGASPGIRMNLTLLRAGERVSLSLTPGAFQENGKTIGRIGVLLRGLPDADRKALMTIVRYGGFSSLQKAVAETYDKSIFTLKIVGKMLMGSVSWRNIGGPITIADYAGQSARLGMDYYLKFLGLISISLGVFNLLPIPILDGGHLLYYGVEAIRRKPLSERSLDIGQRIGVTLLLLLMACSFYNDINRLIHG